MRSAAGPSWWGALVGFCKPDAGTPRPGRLSLFLYSARAVILVISAQAALIAGLLAAGAGRFRWGDCLGVLIGFVVAHAISNLSNDYYGLKWGHDTPDSPRLRYTVHPFADGIVEPRTILIGMALLGAAGMAVLTYFIATRGWTAAAFAAAGLSILWLYDAAPASLKTIGLGEIAVLIVWGPLMIGGGYAMIAGTVSANAMLASLPYGLSVMSILIGKHIDQRDFDAGKGIRTLPVLIGERSARLLLIAAMLAIYITIAALIALGRLTPFAAIAFVAAPRALAAVKLISEPRPGSPPAGYAGWPLWYHRACLRHARIFGWAYIAGLAAAVVGAK